VSELGVLFRAILHQDWTQDYPDVWSAVDYFRSSPDRQSVLAAHREVVEILSREMSETQLLALLDDYDCGYWPPGDNSTATVFLTRLEVELRPQNAVPAQCHAERSAAITEHRAKVRQADVGEARREPGLKGLLGGYLYFGWTSDYDSVWDAVADFVAAADDADVARAHKDVVELLAKRLEDDHLTDILNDDLRTGYSPDTDGMTPTQFLTQLELELRPLGSG
jgi:hypothetical protein